MASRPTTFFTSGMYLSTISPSRALPGLILRALGQEVLRFGRVLVFRRSRLRLPTHDWESAIITQNLPAFVREPQKWLAGVAIHDQKFVHRLTALVFSNWSATGKCSSVGKTRQ